MPRLVPDGPDLPGALLRAWDDDRVVFFCGAGVSARAGLPLFNGLVQDVYKRLDVTPPAANGLDWAFPDRLLGNLEHNIFEPRLVRSAVVESLLRHNDDLGTHTALLQLACFRDRRGLRLVTTNLDHLFEAAAIELGLEAPRFEAPLLPRPLDDDPYSFRGIIYLHGRIAENSNDQRRLVLTSADFGTAYLTEGYARRFVLQLVREFVPVFVGYSLADPSLRYLFDAIDAEDALRRRPRSEPVAYIFREAGLSEPMPGVVEPILYDPRTENGLPHALLHRTLEAWSNWRHDPKARLRRILRGSPDGLPPDDVELVVWSVLGDCRQLGFGAWVFQELIRQAEDTASPPLSWLHVLGNAEVRHLAAHGDRRKEWEKQGRRGVSPDQPRLPLSELVAPEHDAVALPNAAGPLANWLAEYLEVPELATWVVGRLAGRGRRLHPHLRHIVRNALANGKVKEPFATFWSLLTADADWAEPTPRMRDWDWKRMPSSAPLTSLARSELLACLEPRLNLAPSTSRELEDHSIRAMGQEPDQSRTWTLRHLVDAKVPLACGLMDRTVIRRARKLDRGALGDLAWPVTERLCWALDLHKLLAVGSEYRDPSSFHERICDVPEHAAGWELLRPLLWAAWQALDEQDGRASRLLMDRWRLLSHDTFQRLVLVAMGASRHVNVGDVLDALLDNDSRLLWSWSTRADIEQPLQRAWRELDADGRDRLLAAVCSPPPEHQQPPRDGRGARLAMLAAAGGPILPQSAQAYLTAFNAKNEVARANARDVTAAELLALGDDDLVERLTTDTSSACVRAWALAVSRGQSRALGMFERLLADGGTPASVLIEIVWNVSPPSAPENLARQAVGVFADLAVDLIEPRPEVASSLAGFAAKTADQPWCEGAVWHKLLDLWDRLVAPVASATEQPGGCQDTDLSMILPIDDLVHVLLLGLERARSSGQPHQRDSIRTRLDRLATDPATFRASLSQLGRWLPFLHDVEPHWTKLHLLPAFDWCADTLQAGIAWQSFLGGSSDVPAALWSALRPMFSTAFDAPNLSRLGDHARRELAKVLTAILLFGSDPQRLSETEARRLLRACDLDMLRSAAWFLWRAVEDEDLPERRDALWRSRLGHLVRDLWPRELDKRDERVWAWLLRLAIALDETFVEAVDAIRSLPWPPTIDNAGILNELKKSAHSEHRGRADAIQWILALPFEPAGDTRTIERVKTQLRDAAK